MRRILLTGGGTGGHIYPLAAVGERLQEIIAAERLPMEICYIGPRGELNIEFEKLGIKILTITPSKLRRYWDFRNIIDIPRFIWSIGEALFKLYFLMPDVVFSKGGPGALAVLLAAKFYMIPILIHESDAVPSLTTRISAKLAKRIALSFPEAADSLPQGKIALTGNPVRKSFFLPKITKTEAKNSLGFDSRKPLLLILGGSQGAQFLNQFVLENAPSFLKETQIFHQVGSANLIEAQTQLKLILREAGKKEENYKLVDYLDADRMRLTLDAADAVLSRAGSGAIFEIAARGTPAILVPLTAAANNHQKANAYAYAKTGAAEVVEESNLKTNLVLVQMKNIFSSPEGKESAMSQTAFNFAKPAAAQVIAEEILRLIKL